MRPAFMSFRPDGMLREVSRFGERGIPMMFDGEIAAEVQGVHMTDKGNAAGDLQAIFQEEWEAHLQDDPFFATVTGDKRYNDCLPEASEAQAERQAQRLRGFLSRVERIDRPPLSAQDRPHPHIFP